MHVRAERKGGNADGRLYTVVVTATDALGDSVSCTAGCVHVPRDQSPYHDCPCGGVDCPLVTE